MRKFSFFYDFLFFSVVEVIWADGRLWILRAVLHRLLWQPCFWAWNGFSEIVRIFVVVVVFTLRLFFVATAFIFVHSINGASFTRLVAFPSSSFSSFSFFAIMSFSSIIIIVVTTCTIATYFIIVIRTHLQLPAKRQGVLVDVDGKIARSWNFKGFQMELELLF